jgi:hypothetical protein
MTSAEASNASAATLAIASTATANSHHWRVTELMHAA